MEFRVECGRCHISLDEDGPAYLCAKECTFCASCYRKLRYVCPNCAGELVRRPRTAAARARKPPSARDSGTRPSIRPATIRDLDALAPLFDAYRQFYEQPTDLPASRKFLEERLSRDDSKVLVAEEDSAAVGFTQLYPLFSSISLGSVYVLNDLFVHPKARRRGVGERLLEASRSLGERAGVHYLELSTAVDNPAQHLYEKTGWTLDREFLHYELPLRSSTEAE